MSPCPDNSLNLVIQPRLHLNICTATQLTNNPSIVLFNCAHFKFVHPICYSYDANMSAVAGLFCHLWKSTVGQPCVNNSRSSPKYRNLFLWINFIPRAVSLVVCLNFCVRQCGISYQRKNRVLRCNLMILSLCCGACNENQRCVRCWDAVLNPAHISQEWLIIQTCRLALLNLTFSSKQKKAGRSLGPEQQQLAM